MGTAADNLDVLQSWRGTAPPALNQAVTPVVSNRTTDVVAECQFANTIALAAPPSAIAEISPDGVAWQEVDRSSFDVGTVTLSLLGLRILDVLGTGNRKLVFKVPAGWQYRFIVAQPLGAGTLTIQRVQEWTFEVSSHRTTLWEFIAGAPAYPDNSHVQPCDAQCFSPNLFIDQYKRDTSEGYRAFDGAVEPPKGYVRAPENGGGSGTGGGPFSVDFDVVNEGADDGVNGWTAENGSTWGVTSAAGGNNAPLQRNQPVFFQTSTVANAVLGQEISLAPYAATIAANGGTLDVSAWHAPSATSPAVFGDDGQIGIRFLDSGGGTISESYGASSAHGNNGNWIQITHSAAVPANAADFVVLLKDLSPAGQVANSYFDDIRVIGNFDNTGLVGSTSQIYSFSPTNGDAETGDITGWTSSDGLHTVLAGGNGGSDWAFHWNGSAPLNPVPQDLSQAVDVSARATEIDQGYASATCGVYAKLPADLQEFAELYFEFRDGAGNYIGRTDGVAINQALIGVETWTLVTEQAPVPVGARQIVPHLVWAGVAGASQVFFDDVQDVDIIVPDAAGGGAPVDNLHVKGRFDENDPASFTLNWRNTDYTFGDPELTNLGGGEWEFKGDVGAETALNDPEELTISQTGQPDDVVEICIDRSPPTAALVFTGMTEGLSGGAPMLRGEYAKLLPTYSDDNTGIESATIGYQHPAYWTGEPTSAPASGVATAYFRSSANAPTSGDTDMMLTVKDKAGNIATDQVTAFFGALPAVPAVSLSDLSTNIRPAHLNQTEYAETAYDDNTIGARVNIDPPVIRCRNQNTTAGDDTRSQLISGGLSINTSTINNIHGVGFATHSTNVPSQSSKLGVGFKGRVLDQHYRPTDSAEAGDYAFNASRDDDFGQDQTVGIGAPPFTGKGVEPFTDESAGDSLTDARVFDGAVEWLVDGAVLEVTVALAGNTGQLYQPRLFDKSGNEILHATWGDDITVTLHDGTQFVAPTAGDDFGPDASFDIAALNGAASVTARVTVSDHTVPDLGVFILNYKA